MHGLLLALLAACAPPDPTGDGDDAPADDTGTAARNCGPPDADPEPTADGHPTDGWRWTRRGPLFDDETLFGGETMGRGDGTLAPTLVDTGTGLHLLWMMQKGASSSLWSSTSEDADTWTAPRAVTGLDEESYPSLLHDGAGFQLWVGSGSLAHATSDDGVAFSMTETVLRPGDAAFDTLSLLYPHATRTDAGIDLWYTGFDGARFAIGKADCDATAMACTGAGPELERDPSGWDNAAVAMPEVVHHAGRVHTWYGGYDTIIADPGPWRIGRLEGGERRISLPLTPSGAEAWSTRDPAVVPWRDGWRMVYVGMGDDGVYRLMAANSDVCPD
ncbi:MAG: hypothetical protein VX265_08975 [Myxococcota bacterium]|nr:hypothetical protein [Myxococcota bacterium]